ncbi:MAG: phage tail tape measure protein [Muribaculaceae bacterium]|nr:phage tail tape measure protein [Muribaculaceae bacterium]
MGKDLSITIKFDSNGQTMLGKLTISAKELQSAMRKVHAQNASTFRDLTTGISAAMVSLSGLTDGISQLAAPYNAFDQAMRRANTMAQKSGEEFEALRNQVKDLAGSYGIAREEIANGLYETISNGVSEDNWMTFLEQSARSSIGGIADLGEVVKVTSTVIKNYGLSWEDAGHIQDMIQLTAKNGVTSFEQLAQALPRVTTNAAKLGISTAGFMASFSTLTGVTGNTNEVSTQLTAVLTALVKSSREAQKDDKKIRNLIHRFGRSYAIKFIFTVIITMRYFH